MAARVPWLSPASLILGVLAIAIPVLGSLFSDILLPLIDRSESSPSPRGKGTA